MRYFALPLEMGGMLDDDGQPVTWATCPDLPGAYEEAPTREEALERLAALARHIIAEHLVREDPLDPVIIVADAPLAADGDTLVLALSDEEIEQVRALPLLEIEQPEP
jgi:hypothetical protein